MFEPSFVILIRIVNLQEKALLVFPGKDSKTLEAFENSEDINEEEEDKV